MAIRGHQGQSGVIRVAIRGHPGHSPIPKFCEVALNYLIRVDVDDLAERLRGKSTEAIRGHQRSSGVIRGHQRQSNDFAERLRGRHRNPSQSSTITCGKSTSRKRILYPQMSRCFSVCSRRCDGQSYCTIATGRGTQSPERQRPLRARRCSQRGGRRARGSCLGPKT